MTYSEYSDGVAIRKCLGERADGKRCQRKRWSSPEGWYCWQHEDQEGTEAGSL